MIKEYLITFSVVTTFKSKGGAQIRNKYKEFFEGESAKEATQKMYSTYSGLGPSRDIVLHDVKLVGPS